MVDNANGEPIAPLKNVKKFINQCGVLVRDNVPITIRDWNKPKVEEGASYVDQRLKELLWGELLTHFTLPKECDVDKVKKWALKKMVTQFQTFKKNLKLKYVDKNETPNFKGYLEKQKNHWADFVKYKTSSEAKKGSEIKKKNAREKKYHHKLGPGGYKTAETKWEKNEDDLRAKGLIPETENWPKRSRNWWLAHGGVLDPETGSCMVLLEDKAMKIVSEDLISAINDASEGKFVPDREND